MVDINYKLGNNEKTLSSGTFATTDDIYEIRKNMEELVLKEEFK